MKTITIRNDYHHTIARVRAHADRETLLTARTVSRLRRALCWGPCCTCGGVLGQRGPQAIQIMAMPAGEALLLPL